MKGHITRRRLRSWQEAKSMKLTGNLKKQVEKAGSKDEAEYIIEKAGMKLTDDQMEMVSGGSPNMVNTNPRFGDGSQGGNGTGSGGTGSGGS